MHISWILHSLSNVGMYFSTILMMEFGSASLSVLQIGCSILYWDTCFFCFVA